MGRSTLYVTCFVKDGALVNASPLPYTHFSTYIAPPSLFAALPANKAALEVEKVGDMQPAGMGRGDGIWHGQQSRGDSILWITDGIRGKGDLAEVCSILQNAR